LKKLTTREELSGVFNSIIEEFLPLLESGRFAKEDSIEKNRDLYVRASNSIESFVLDCLVQDENNFITKEKLFLAYVDYCRLHKIIPESKIELGRELSRYIPVREAFPKVDGRQVTAWKGINFKNGVLNSGDNVTGLNDFSDGGDGV